MLTSLSAGMSRHRWARTAKLGARELPLPPRHTAGLRASWLTHPKGCWWHGQIHQEDLGATIPGALAWAATPLGLILISFIYFTSNPFSYRPLGCHCWSPSLGARPRTDASARRTQHPAPLFVSTPCKTLLPPPLPRQTLQIIFI